MDGMAFGRGEARGIEEGDGISFWAEPE
jgi:hypothetical protein